MEKESEIRKRFYGDQEENYDDIINGKIELEEETCCNKFCKILNGTFAILSLILIFSNFLCIGS
jgi:hypothetical protein